MTAIGGDSMDDFAAEIQPSKYAICPGCRSQPFLGEKHDPGCQWVWTGRNPTGWEQRELKW